MSFFVNEQKLPSFWYNEVPNFGDTLTPIIIQHYLNKKAQWIIPKYYKREHLIGVGSLLKDATENSIVWGTGFISDDCSCINIPKRVLAVRGPKTREKLLKLNIVCPEIYGDPALLLPRIYNPIVQKKYELGIIPHYVDYQNIYLNKFRNMDNLKILNIQTNNTYEFIQEVLSCKNIISSSLHGLIIADAYNIPNAWIKFSENILGNDFKFYDYFLSVKRIDQSPVNISNDVSMDYLLSLPKLNEIKIDTERLINSLTSYYKQ